MITGDNQLTAAFIGLELSFANSQTSLFASKYEKERITWRDIDDK